MSTQTIRPGTRVRVQEAYEAVVLGAGPIPDGHPCSAHRGLPGYEAQWYELDEITGAYTGALEPERDWVLQAQTQAV